MLTQVQILGAPPPLKFGRAKKVQKSVQFRQLSSLSANISRTDEDNHIVYGVDESYPFGVEQKKFCEIPSTTNQVISANVNLP